MREDEQRGITRRVFVGYLSVPAAVSLGVPVGADAATTMVQPEQPPQNINIVLNLNGAKHALSIDSRVTLLDALRDRIGLTGTKKGCDQGTCGACTVLVNGRRIVSCLTLAAMHEHDSVTTIEGLAKGDELHPVQAAFIKHDGFQCGFCTSGQIVSAVGMLAEGHATDRETIQRQMSGNLCRCGCYPHIVDAIAQAGQGA